MYAIVIFAFFRSLCTQLRQLAKSNVNVSTYNVDVNKSIDKLFIPGSNVSPRNVMQTNLGLSWDFFK